MIDFGILKQLISPAYKSIATLQDFLQTQIVKSYNNNAPTDLLECSNVFQNKKKTFLEFAQLFYENSHSMTFSRILNAYVSSLTEVKASGTFSQLPAEIRNLIDILLGNEQRTFSEFGVVINALKEKVTAFLKSSENN